MEMTKKVLKGQLLFKEGDKADFVYLVQTGRISIFLARGKSKIEVAQLSASQIAGVQALFGQTKHLFSAEAIVNSTYVEMPVEVFKTKFEGLSNVHKLLLKSMFEDIKNSFQTIRSMRTEQDQAPCPQILIPRLFGTLFYIGTAYGEATDGGLVLPWSTYRTYSIRMFMEAPNRIEGLLQLLSKLGWASYTTKLNEEETQDEIDEVTIKNIKMIWDFADFYQYNLYKPGRSEIMYIDPFVFQRLKALTAVTAELPADSRGILKVPFDPIAEKILKEHKVQLKLEHLQFFENKGLLLQRRVEDDNIIYLLFNKEEFYNVSHFWQLISEIEQWNQLGYVDLKVSAEEASQEEAKNKCPQCKIEIKEDHKFCANCGFRLKEE